MAAVIAAFQIEVAIVIRVAHFDDWLPKVEEKHAIDHVVVALA